MRKAWGNGVQRQKVMDDIRTREEACQAASLGDEGLPEMLADLEELREMVKKNDIEYANAATKTRPAVRSKLNTMVNRMSERRKLTRFKANECRALDSVYWLPPPTLANPEEIKKDSVKKRWHESDPTPVYSLDVSTGRIAV